MKEWFKMRTVWGASIQRMTAEEAGRLIKAVYLYERTGERQVLPGPEGILYAMIEEVLVRDDEEMAALSEKRAAAGAAGGRRARANRRAADETERP